MNRANQVRLLTAGIGIAWVCGCAGGSGFSGIALPAQGVLLCAAAVPGAGQGEEQGEKQGEEQGDEPSLGQALALLDPLERSVHALGSQGDDITALFGVAGHTQAARTRERARAVIDRSVESAAALSAALRRASELPSAAGPEGEDRALATARAEDALAMLIPLRAARSTLVLGALSGDPAERSARAREARAALLAIEPGVPWAVVERGVLLAVADSALGDGRGALDHLLDARNAIRADPRLADPALRLTLQIGAGSVLATLAEAGPDDALRALERIAERPPFAVDPEAAPGGAIADPFARLLLADLNARIELARLDAGGGMDRSSRDLRARVLDRIASGYARTLDEPALGEHRESLRVLAMRRLARLVPESIPMEELPVLAALARIARIEQLYQQELERVVESGGAGAVPTALARRVVEMLRALASRTDDPARSIRADVVYDLSAAEQRIGEDEAAARRLIEFTRIAPEDDRAGGALARAMALAEGAGNRSLALEAGRLAHTAPFPVERRDALRVRLIALLCDGQAYRISDHPARFDLRGFFGALYVECDEIAASVDGREANGLALREALVSGDAWALALAERFPEEVEQLGLTPAMVADQSERRGTDLLTFEPPGGARGLSPMDRARVLAHRARAWLALGRPNDAVLDLEMAIDSLGADGAASGDPARSAALEEVEALLVRASAEARQHDRAMRVLEGAAARTRPGEPEHDRLLAIITALGGRTRSLIDANDRPFPADPDTEAGAATIETLSWLPERSEFLLRAASLLAPDETGWHEGLRFEFARSAVLGGEHAAAIEALERLHADGRASIPSLLLLGEAHLMAGADAPAFGAFRRVVESLDAMGERDPSLWRAWARMVEILERQASSDPTGRRLSGVQRQIRRLRLREGYDACVACREKIEAVATRIGVDAPPEPDTETGSPSPGG
ncbi:MAG: hypothetical protein ACTS3F_05055 [Phycisphaerales bacterium]